MSPVTRPLPREGMWSGGRNSVDDCGRVRSVANAEVSSTSAVDFTAMIQSPPSPARRAASRGLQSPPEGLPAGGQSGSSRFPLRREHTGTQRDSPSDAGPGISAAAPFVFRGSAIASLARRVTASCEPNQHHQHQQQPQALASFPGRASAHDSSLYPSPSSGGSHSPHPQLHRPDEHSEQQHLSLGQHHQWEQQQQQQQQQLRSSEAQEQQNQSERPHDQHQRSQQQDPQQPHHAVELTIKDRAIAAGAAAVLSAVIMNPLDVAKTRLQAQAAGYSYTQGTPNAPCNNCGSPWPDPITRRHLASYQLEWLRGALDLGHPHPSPATAASVGADGAACAVACDFPQPTVKAYRGPLDVFLRVIREEGAVRLWRGTSAGLLMAVPSVGIYMPVYDSLLARLALPGPGQTEAPWTAPYAPLVAGALSRSLACVLCSPLELARTRIQAGSQTASGAGAHSSQAVSGRSILSTLQHAVRAEGGRQGKGHGEGVSGALARMRVLWRGVDVQLARDVPFSAICWSILEPTRKALLALDFSSGRGHGERLRHSTGTEQHKEWAEEGEGEAGLGRILAANFGAGVVAGSLAAAVTTPLDVAKTRVQIEMSASVGGRGVGYHLTEIWREGGWRALYTGVGPRSIKAGPSVGIIVSFYEIMKHILARRVDSRS